MSRSIFPMITETDKMLPFYIHSIGERASQELVTRPNGYPHFHWLYCLSGKGKLLIDGNEYIITPNSSFFFCPNVEHKYYPINEPWRTRWITFNGCAVAQVLSAIKIGSWKLLQSTNPETANKYFDAIYSLMQSVNPFKALEASSMLYQFIIDVLHDMNVGTLSENYPGYGKLSPVLAYVKENYDKPLTLEELSKLVNVTPYHLCRLFKQVLNMRPFSYITAQRLQRAKEIMLESSSTPIADIAEKVGYNNASYFCSLFKEYEGVTPTEFKLMHL